MHSPDSKPPPFTELSSNPPPESTTVYRPPPVETIENALPEINTNRRPQPVESMPSPLPELNTSQKHLETSMGDHANAAIVIASSSQPPFSIEAETEAEIPPPAYDHSLTPTSSPSLQKPIVIPATTGKLGSPFLRCYAPILEQYHFPRDVFLKHLDALNRVAVASPPLQVLGFADEFSKVLPLPPVHLVGSIIGGFSRLGTNGVTYGRTEMYLKDLNKDVFGPRGLKIEVANMKAVAKLSNMPVLTADGRLDRNTRLLDDLQPHELATTSGHQRRLRALTPWIEEVEVIPDIPEKTGMLRNMSTKMSEHDRKRHEKQLLRNRKQWHDQHTQEMDRLQREHDRRMDEMDGKEADIMREERMEKKEAKMDRLMREKERSEREFETRKNELERRRSDGDQEEQEMRNTRWLVITNLNQAISRTGSQQERTEKGR